MNLTKVFIIIFLICNSYIILFSSELSINKKINNSILEFNLLKQTNNNNLIGLAKNSNKNINNFDNNNNYAKSRNIDLFKTGVNLLVFGIVSGTIGSGLLSTGFIFTWILSLQVGWTFESTLAGLITSYTFFGEYSFFASLAIASWVIGGIFLVLLLMIIPGSILMTIGSRRISSNFRSLDDAIGVSIKIK